MSLTPIRAFEAQEYAARLDRLRAAMERARVDVVILSSPEAMCWLHGYQSRWYSNGSTTEWPPPACTVAHVDHDRFITFESRSHAALLERTSVSTDNRYVGETAGDDAQADVVEAMRAEGWLHGRVGLEMWSPVPNPALSRRLEALLAKQVDVVDATRVVRDVQRLKSAAEIEVIREAARIADVGMRRLAEVLTPELTELEASAEMILAMAREGGEPAALHQIVCGASGLAGHSISAAQPVGSGATYADPCGVKHRYHANMCRTFFLGEPPPELVELGRIAGGAFDVLVDTARTGTPFSVVSRSLRDYYKDAGVWDLRSWVGGYQLGIAFPPDWVGEFVFSVDVDESDKIVEHGLVTNFESVVGVGMIDTVVYLDEGPEILSSVPRELVVLA